MRSKVSSNWLPSHIKATRPVLEIFKMAGYFPGQPSYTTPKKRIRSSGTTSCTTDFGTKMGIGVPKNHSWHLVRFNPTDIHRHFGTLHSTDSHSLLTQTPPLLHTHLHLFTHRTLSVLKQKCVHYVRTLVTHLANRVNSYLKCWAILVLMNKIRA